jgi:Raf kinase inhibitor-like YbhB/YbcL family protein
VALAVFRLLRICSLALLLLPGCKKEDKSPQEDWGDPTMQLTSTAFKEGEAIPKQYTADGKNVSPPLKWTGAPQGTKSFALICDDPDAPNANKMWVHWVLYNLPADQQELPEKVPTTETLERGGGQGKNDFKKIGYGGPSPPSGTHRYFFKVYALDDVLKLSSGATKADLEKAMKGHVLAHGQLMGKYSR